MADSWEDEEFEAPAVVTAVRKWDDEDAEDDVKDSWDMEEEEEEEDKPSATPAPPVKKKVPLAQRIAEREAEKERQRKELEEKNANEKGAEELTEEELFERRQQELRMQKESDLQNAADLFQGIPATTTSPEATLETIQPKTKAEFEEFSKMLVTRVHAFQKSPFYMQFLDTLVHDLATPLKDVDVRKLASTLTALSNEKIKQAREKEKGKKNKGSAAKKPLTAIKQVSEMDTTDYGTTGAYAHDDYDDFM